MTSSVHFEDFLAAADAGRVVRVLRKLDALGLADHALVGGLALELNLALNPERDSAASGRPRRPLNDIDLVVPDFGSLPGRLSDEFLVCHVHPYATPGRLMLQVVDAEEELRVDVFCGWRAAISRSRLVASDLAGVRVVSTEDLAASAAASMLMRLDRGERVSAKKAADFERVCDSVDGAGVKSAWNEHRGPDHPNSFADARSMVVEKVRAGGDRFALSRDAVCPRCEEAGAFRLSSAREAIRDIGGNDLILLLRERGLTRFSGTRE